jgi:GxxExxY protein
MTENEIGYSVRGACFNVYNALGPGLLESAYERALCVELQDMGLTVQSQVPVKMSYKGRELGDVYRIDLLVEGKVIIEIKSIDKLEKVHYKQLHTYLTLTDMKLGYLVNFNTDDIKENIVRYVNKL